MPYDSKHNKMGKSSHNSSKKMGKISPRKRMAMGGKSYMSKRGSKKKM